MKKGNRLKKPVRATRAPLYIALSVFAAMAMALVVLLAGRSKAFALEIPADYALTLDDLTKPDSGITAVAGGDKEYLINGEQGFITLARVSQNDDLAGCSFRIARRESITLSVVYGEGNNVLSEKSFFGIGSDEKPFRGRIIIESVTDDTAITMDGWKVLFNNLSTKASILSEDGNNGRRQLVAHEDGAFALCDTLTVEEGGTVLDISGFRFAEKTGSGEEIKGVVKTDRPAGLVAAKVVGTGSCEIRLSSSLLTGKAYEVQATGGTVGGLLGAVEGGVELNVTLPEELDLTATTAGGHAGALVGENKGRFTVSGLATLAATATADGYAVGLVGANSGEIDFANDITVSSITARGDCAGGVVGENRQGAEVTFSGHVTLTQVTATGNIVGGAAGVSEGSFSAANCTVESAKLTATGDGPVMGGFVGNLTVQAETNIENISVGKADFFGTGTNTAHTVGGYFGLLTAHGQVNFTSAATSKFTFDSVKSGHMGGIIGRVAGNSAVTVSGNEVNNTFCNNDFSGTLGGAAGTVERGAYLKTGSLSVTNTMDKTAEGMADLVGVAEDRAIVDVNGVTYKNTNKDSVLVSKTEKGSVLRLSGTITDTSVKSGHIVRTQDDSLLYAEGGVSYISATPTRNDVGNYGQILRNGNIIVFDEANHTVTVKEPISASDIRLSSHVDAAKLAITLQTHGVFSGVEGIDEKNYRDLLSASITLTGNVDLTNTGVEQFTCAAESAPFTGTIDGGGHTLTLAIGETIRKENINSSTQNVGILRDDVNARTYVGAFSALSNATVENLIVGGTITYRDHIDAGGTLRIGGLAGYASNSVSISGCTTKLAVTLNAPSSWVNRNNVYAGGLIGQAENADLTVTDCVTEAKIDHIVGYLNNKDDGRTVCLGGAIGKATVRTDKEINFTGNTLKAQISQGVQAYNSHVGGFIADLVCANYVDVNMAGTTADGASVSSGALSTAGGLIGYSFQKCRLTLDSAWAGTVSAQSSVGGLLYKLDGKLTAEERFSVNGGAFTSAAGDLGAILGDGADAFVIIRSAPENFTDIPTNFDLLVGKNITATASNGVAAEGGLVTVETGDGIGKLPGTTNGWYTLMNSHSNGNTRYYFNVAGLEKRAATTTASSPADLIYWNVYDFVQSALPDYVMRESFPAAVNDIENASADVDLSGYCFYPTKKEGVTFDFGGHKLTFGVENPPAAAQFYGLQSGVFSDITTGSGDITANFGNIILAGTVQPVGGNSGAFVCGKIVGKSDTGGTAIARVTVSKVFLSGLTVAGTADYRPLLIHTIDSYSSCTISDLSQYTEGTYKIAGKNNTYGNDAKAASSLIGRGGVSSNGKLSEYVSVTFKDIVLAGETGDTIFTKATLFDSIACTDNTSSLTYNFNLADDWNGTTHSKAVTYGTELSTNPKQYEYHDQKLFVNPTAYPTQTTGANGNFNTGYMPYVRAADTSSAVLRVNWKVVVFDGGWGTYEHPYEISKPEQLTFLSELVGGTVTGFDSGWNILYPKKVNDTLDYTQGEQYTADSSGALKRVGGTDLPVAQLLAYLRGAYYKITVATLTAEDGFVGIGNKENPFHGVIAGWDGTGNTVIQMPNKSGVDSAGYGFINTANGCAVYGLDIRYDKVGLSNNTYNGATSRPFSANASTGVSHFGSVIAWVIGGDNVIDNVSVSVNTLTAGHKTSVFGGYVGFVTGGGVTVRGLGGGVNNTLTAADSGYYYYNPYVGKMLCGYVLSDVENERYDNTDKNYDIPIITKKKATTLYKGNTFTLADEADVYMLGFAINGGAFKNNVNKDKGLAGDDAIAYGKNSTSLSRHGNYSGVGIANQDVAQITSGRYEDDGRAAGTSLFSDYFGTGVTSIDQNTNLTLKFAGEKYDLSTYPNAFRGFGSPYAGTECYNIKTVMGTKDADGNPATTIILNMDLKQYFMGPNYEPDSVKNLALVSEITGTGNVFSDITISGKVALNAYNLKNDGKLLDYKAKNGNVLFCQAGFVGYAAGARFDDVAIQDLVVESPGWAAGLVGSEQDTNANSMVKNCHIDKLRTKALQSTGAVYAYLRAGTGTAMENVTVKNSEIRLQSSGLDGDLGKNYNASVGGLVGYIESEGGNRKLTVNRTAVSDSSVLVVTKRSTNNTTAESADAGGLVGCLNKVELSLTDCQVDGSVVAAVLVNANDTVLAPDYTNVVGLRNAVFDKVQNMAAYLLDKNVSEIRNGNAGGIVGYATGKTTMESVRLTSNNQHSTVILGSDNAGGFVGVGAAAQTYTDLTAQTDGNPIYIIGKSRAAGATAYGNNAVTAKNITVQGVETAPVYILGDGTEAPAAGLFADLQNGNSLLNSTNADVSGCIIAGAGAAGAVVRNTGNAVLSNLKLFDNFIQGSNSAAGVLNTADANTILDGLYLGNNVIRKSGNETNAGVIADTVKENGATLTGYDLLLKGNDAGYGAAKTSRQILEAESRDKMYAAAESADKVGLVAYKNLGTVNILAISAEEGDYPRFADYHKNDHVIFAGYGVPSLFETKYAGDPAYTPKQALADCGITPAGLESLLNGDPVTKQGEQFMADFLNEKTVNDADKLWYNAKLHLSSTGMAKLLSLVPGGVTDNGDLPVLHITGQTNDTMTAYLNLITNGGYGALSDSAFHIASVTSSDRYALDADGKLSLTGKGEGSVRYEDGKFTAGKYDNLESAEKTLSVLTVTFADPTETHTYTLHAVVYYPQVLEYKSAISALEGEVYQLSAFNAADKDTGIDIMAGSKFAFYMEYAYNNVAEKIEEYNLDKFVYSHKMGSPTQDGDQFTAGTKMVLIDINSKNAAGFKSYYYTVGSDTATIQLKDFVRGTDTPFDEIDLQQVVKNGLTGKIADPNYPYVERYLMVVVPPDGDQTQKQFNLVAKVPTKNEKNITVRGQERRCSISVWSAPGAELKFNEEKTSALFSNTADKALRSELSVRQEFSKEYVLAMDGRELYGTHILKVTKNGENSGITLPAGTVVTLTDSQGTLLMSTRLTQPTSSIRYSVGNVLERVSADALTYTDNIEISLDFSGASPLEFNRSFDDGYQYILRDSFYLSGDMEHYAGGTETSCTTKTIKAEKASLIKLALVPRERKHLAINFGNLSETTDSGKIEFDLSTDFSAVLDEKITIDSTTVQFSVVKKVQGDDGRYVYQALTENDLVVRSLTDENGQLLTDHAAALSRSSESAAKTMDAFRLTVDVDAIRSRIPTDDEQAQNYDVFTNYRLVADVTVKGRNTEKDEEVTYTATSYFTFLLCNIHADVF